MNILMYADAVGAALVAALVLLLFWQEPENLRLSIRLLHCVWRHGLTETPGGHYYRCPVCQPPTERAKRQPTEGPLFEGQEMQP